MVYDQVNTYYILKSTTVTQTIQNVVPSKPLSLRVTARNDTAFHLAWNRPGNNGPAITGYRVRDPDTTSNVYYVGADTTAVITGLTPETTYKFEVAAQNAQGWSAYSDVLEEATVPEGATVPATPLLPIVLNATASTIGVRWVLPADNKAPLQYVKLEVREDGLFTEFEEVYRGLATEYVITGLKVATEYQVRVAVACPPPAAHVTLTNTHMSPLQVRIIATNAVGDSLASVAKIAWTTAGDPCPTACNGRGSCDNGVCVCDEGFAGDTCQLTSLKACFSDGEFCLLWAFDGDNVHVTMAAQVTKQREGVGGASSHPFACLHCTLLTRQPPDTDTRLGWLYAWRRGQQDDCW